MDDELLQLDLPSADLLSDGGEIFVNVLDDSLCGFAGQDLVQNVTTERVSMYAMSLARHSPTWRQSWIKHSIHDVSCRDP